MYKFQSTIIRVLFIFRRVNNTRERSCWFMAFSTVKIEKSKQMITWMNVQCSIIYDTKNWLIYLFAFFGLYIFHLLTLVEYRFDWTTFLIDDTLCRMYPYRHTKHLTVHRYRSFRLKLRHFKNSQYSLIYIYLTN